MHSGHAVCVAMRHSLSLMGNICTRASGVRTRPVSTIGREAQAPLGMSTLLMILNLSFPTPHVLLPFPILRFVGFN